MNKIQVKTSFLLFDKLKLQNGKNIYSANRKKERNMSILNKKSIAVIGGALAVITITGSIVSIYAKAAVKVNSLTIEKSDMQQVLELSGSIMSNDSDTFFAKTNLKVDRVYFKAGDEVKKGDLLLTFDEAEIDKSVEILKLNAAAAEGGYLNALQTSDKYNALYAEATRNLNVLNNQIKETEESIINKQKEISDRCSAIAYEGTKIQISLVDNASDATASANLQKQAQNNVFYQTYDSELLRLEEELARLNMQLADFKEYKAEMISQKASSYPGVLTEGGRAELEAVKEAGELNFANEIEKYEDAKKGIKAEFDGIVSQVYVSEGSLVTEGLMLLSVDSSEDIGVRCNANKYDIMSIEKDQVATVKIVNTEYEGKVSRIDKIAGLDATAASGIGVDIKLENADNLILGYEVKAKINTTSIKDTICIPKEALVTKDDINYVFVAKDRKAVKTIVETGIKNGDYVEIVSGLNVDDILVWSDTKELKDGEEVRY